MIREFKVMPVGAGLTAKYVFCFIARASRLCIELSHCKDTQAIMGGEKSSNDIIIIFYFRFERIIVLRPT